ncbi:MAG: shikimate kinase [Ignavibacteria bacterium RBG_13_36_8]|nr:MAG: shikimate kinase [Ignavibacteria bacterium RBG_13_36_8]
MKVSRLFLTGFMTSGKSTIGPILANVLGWDFFDLDKVIEKSECKSIVEIFENRGEDYFRTLETDTLMRLSKLEKVVISLGGGTIANEENFNIIKKSGKIVYLKVSPEILYKRLKYKIDRPLFRDLVLSDNSEEEFVSKIKEILTKRETFYNKADLVINTDISPVGITVDKLVKKISMMVYEKSCS